MYNKLDFEIKSTVKKMFGLKRADDINMIPDKKHEGPKDHDVFAIAIMTSLAFNEDPSCVTCGQSHLRSHLVDYFINTRFTPFPKDQNVLQ